MMIHALKTKWKVYSMEAICLGIFMLSASFFATLLESPEYAIHNAIENDFVRLCLMGVAMGVTAVFLNYSPMGKLSGAHMNPAVTLTFLRLGKIKSGDALYYICFQIAGGTLGVLIIAIVMGSAFQEPPIDYIITRPGKPGPWVAFAIETLMSFAMMTMVLLTSNHPRWNKYTGIIAGFFVTGFIILSAPISGFSINPARSLASALPAMQYPAFWIYLTAPFIGMLAASEIFVRLNGKAICAKMHHSDSYLCIFDCGYCKHQHDDEMTSLNPQLTDRITNQNALN